MTSVRRLPWRLALVALVALTAATPGAASGATPPVLYRLSFPEPTHHYAQVEVTFAAVPDGPLEVRMSRSSPGRYAMHQFAKNVYDLQAFNGVGRELRPTRPSPSQWDIAGHDGTVRILYKVFGNRVDGTYLAVDASHAHINIPATLLWARGFDARGASLTFAPPPGSGWKPATQLFPTADPWVFTAPNLQYLMDSPVELSDGTLRSFIVRNPDGATFTIRTALHSDGGAAAADQYAAGVERIVNEAAAIFGEFPAYETGTYTFLGDYVPWGGGDGMEHRNSTVVSSATSFRTPQAVSAAFGTVAHEFFHCWNVERIRPRSLEPFNFEDVNISGELWLAEGFTSYYGPLIVARAGLRPGEEGPGLLGSAAEVLLAPGRAFHSPVEMSQMAAFTDAAAAIDETNFSNTFISYYTYGAAVAVALDFSLRDRSDGRVTLDDYMRAMWRAHGEPGGTAPGLVARPYTLQDARDRLAEVSGSRAFADDFFDRYVEGHEAPDYARLFARAGFVLKPRHPDEPWVGLLDGGGAAAGRRGRRPPTPPTAAASGLTVPELVRWGSPAYAAGLDQGDVITAADGVPITSVQGWQAAVAARRPGDHLSIDLVRQGRSVRATITVAADPTIDIVTVESTGVEPTAAQRAFRRAWLEPRRK